MKRETAMSLKPDWRIKIYKDSEIFWPSLIAGKKVANGYVESPT